MRVTLGGKHDPSAAEAVPRLTAVHGGYRAVVVFVVPIAATAPIVAATPIVAVAVVVAVPVGVVRVRHGVVLAAVAATPTDVLVVVAVADPYHTRVTCVVASTISSLKKQKHKMRIRGNYDRIKNEIRKIVIN